MRYFLASGNGRIILPSSDGAINLSNGIYMPPSNPHGKAGTLLHNHYLQRALLVLWICLVAVIMYVGLKPSPMSLTHPADKFVHIGGCAVVILLPAILIRQVFYLFASAAILFLAGAGIELYQSFLPGRQASTGDLLADVVGIILGIGLGRLVRYFYRK